MCGAEWQVKNHIHCGQLVEAGPLHLDPICSSKVGCFSARWAEVRSVPAFRLEGNQSPNYRGEQVLGIDRSNRKDKTVLQELNDRTRSAQRAKSSFG